MLKTSAKDWHLARVFVVPVPIIHSLIAANAPAQWGMSMKINWDENHYRVFGLWDGSFYMQNGRYFDINGDLIEGEAPTAAAPEVVEDVSAEPEEPVIEEKAAPEEEPPTPFDPSQFFVSEPKNIVPQYELNYTEEDLLKIADKEGITGLRKIAKPIGVRGRGKSELIKEILEAQKHIEKHVSGYEHVHAED